jgi:hypothetical protein
MYDESKQANLIDKWITRAQHRPVRSDWGEKMQAIWPECAPVEEKQYGDDGQEGDVGSDYEHDPLDVDEEDVNNEVIQPEMSQQELVDKLAEPRISKLVSESCISDGDSTEACSDGSEEEDEAWRSQSRDVNARGEKVSWEKFLKGGIDERNVVHEARGCRSKRKRRDVSADGMVRFDRYLCSFKVDFCICKILMINISKKKKPNINN